MNQLGRLEKVNLRDIWANEEYDFSVWLSKEENLKDLDKRDEQRNHYYQKFTGTKRDDPQYYDMVINVGKVGVNNAVNMILNYIKQKEME